MIVVEEDLNYPEAARALRLSVRSIKRLKAAGKLSYNDPFGDGSRITFSPHHLDDFRRKVEKKAKAN